MYCNRTATELIQTGTQQIKKLLKNVEKGIDKPNARMR